MNDVSGFDELENAIRQIAEELNEGATQLLEETATECVGEIQSRTPVKTGNLRRSWTYDEVKTNGTEKSVQLGSAVEYAEPVEEGYRRGNTFVEGKHMMKDSISIAQREFQKKVDNMVSRTFGR
ncbi:HK97 gp10 family phage protein [Clostridium saccharobutylicum]|uniref:Bacteriophage HK97-gp10, putative tail-component n=1 Tax=Clostridium saccharobutylicum DSM 13864 TaxID=1345695 RepID=U5MWF9_CLOSA|nr:HK97 gp10 family phage protein [Clostridium saccharobutylicum]AGX43956.1 bacteriophage HK97-gp10, putative tail-component [Clostridium saccharobutylicum DSM 13864]AQR91253.1 hypothetical protein CLOSC_29770 [Clostridium saccharobutylicum]AQS01157.1 hypothetical protein CSACC_29840 [Clostridium saccharobutylicum]AQS10570.1 hypothetical protein CLOBY_27150 [Clostridium saccharobutylicum]AQS15140.1 hypothetical protein CLOSACC_29840 [Clostridium saccharobutylicum]